MLVTNIDIAKEILAIKDSLVYIDPHKDTPLLRGIPKRSCKACSLCCSPNSNVSIRCNYHTIHYRRDLGSYVAHSYQDLNIMKFVLHDIDPKTLKLIEDEEREKRAREQEEER